MDRSRRNKTEETSYASFVDFFGKLSILIYCFGLEPPGIEKKVANRPLLRFVHKTLNSFSLFFFVMFFVDINIGMVKLLNNFRFAFFVRTIIHIVTCLAHIHRLYIYRHDQKLFLQVMNIIDSLMADQKNNVAGQKSRIHQRTILHATVLFIFISTTGPSVFFTGLYIYKNHGSPIKTNYWFLSEIVAGMYTSVIPLAATLTSLSYYTLLLSLLAIFSNILAILREELSDIYSIIRDNEKGEVYYVKGSTNLVKQDDLDSKTLIEREANVKLIEWVKKHNMTVICMNKLTQYFRVANAINAAGVITMAASFISTSLKGSHPPSVVTFSIFSFISFLIASSYGNKVQKEAEQITYDALGKSFYLYPIGMQKSLRFILEFSQRKRYAIDLFRLYPLNLEQFFTVSKLCFSYISFLSGFTISKD